MTTNLETALHLAKQGFAIFPCQPGGETAKRPMPFIKWADVSTTDDNQIKRWWLKWPDAAIGLDLAKSGLIVIDCDRHGEDDGVLAFGTLCVEHHHDIDQSPLVATPNDGCHVFFRQQSDKERGNRKGNLPNGIDVRGKGGYVLAPGTVMQDGRLYELCGDLSTTPPLPDWLAKLIDDEKEQPKAKPIISTHKKQSLNQEKQNDTRITSYCDAAIDAELSRIKSAAKGTRNNTLNESAFSLGQLVGAGWISESEIFNLLFNAALDAGLNTIEAKKTIQSGLNAGQKEPRALPDNDMPNFDPVEAEKINQTILTSLENKKREEEGTKQIIQQNDGTLIDENTGEIIENKNVYTMSIQCDLPYPQGLVGAIARWITETARYPQPALSIGAALAIVGTLAGRQFAGPTRSGTHLYVLGLAPTGKGKDHALQQIMRIMGAVKLPQHIGPSEFISMPAVINFLTRKPLSICAMDEFGDFMKRINSRRASGFENAISKVLRTLWSASFSPFVTPEWASRQSESIYCPAITIYGASTPEQFYSAMEGSNLENGTLNRFLLINGDSKVKECEPSQDKTQVPESIISGLKRIYERSGTLSTGFRNDAHTDPAANGQLVDMAWCPDGSYETYKDFSSEISNLMSKKIEAEAFYARTAEMALRIATIIAIGRNDDDQVRKSDIDYGILIARQSAEFMEIGAADYMSNNENQANAQRITRTLKARGGRMSHRELIRSLQNSIKSRDLKELLMGMIESGEIEKLEMKNSRGPTTVVYQLS